ARYMSQGGLKDTFWGPFFAVGSLIPCIMLCIALFVPGAQPVLLGLAGILALAGLYAYEHCFVVAGQVVPLSEGWLSYIANCIEEIDMTEIPLQQHIAPSGEQMTVRDLV